MMKQANRDIPPGGGEGSGHTRPEAWSPPHMQSGL